LVNKVIDTLSLFVSYAKELEHARFMKFMAKRSSEISKLRSEPEVKGKKVLAKKALSIK